MPNFERYLADRRESDSVKWRLYGPGVLPMWVADMDFRSPDPVTETLCDRAAEGVFGYGVEPPRLREVLAARLWERYGWRVTEEDLIFLPGVVTGFNLACRALTAPGDGLLMMPPVYPPILHAPENHRLLKQESPLVRLAGGRYEIDFDGFEAAITAETRLLLLCSPHNPVGRVFTVAELERLGEICLRHHVLVCSDEIHCDLIFGGQRHTPIAALSPELAAATVTLMAPSKTYNIAGLDCSVAIVTDPALRKTIEGARDGLVGGVNILGFKAAMAAYEHGEPWLQEALAYLEGNRDFLVRYVQENMPGIEVWSPEGTYLAWLRCAGMPDPACFFLERAKVAVNEGRSFGLGGPEHVRLNFGCARATLLEALDRMCRAWHERDAA